ncbi:uncharacterized protein MONOS_12578 [Monocercomonoides exilis]|uniref:uncharacterized protein n=1 Tax=Monocercomonoides exilis TaxID=2049356 RepID=UPI003559DAF5|nr:hypothetical protein MONOS_12578 [Monocercomonoides exilis]|eukprot:MONOS_12578.1-p1 / transcript=MONOS_12578.1 / gene=MONOS_12578 / organism=Monocercomonoides_exilis_PA203 / gene_product=unspecified product / transcript_product=unspecified product / location=Mono_scaffold00704:31340-32548(+) / protein_length=232 / sequence_SO=supercontig / SO=protein_coding / is_pseudo=false
MPSFKYRQFRNPLERIALIVNDGAAQMEGAYNSKKNSKIRIRRVVNADLQSRLVFKIGRPAVVIGEKEQTVLDEIEKESLSGASLTIKKMRELVKNVGEWKNVIINECDRIRRNYIRPENTPDVKVSASVAYDFIKQHPELKTSKPKIVEASMISVSCQQSSLRVPGSSNRNVVHPANTKPGYAKSAARMANSPLIVVVPADGQSLPSVILYPSLKLPDELKPLQSSNVEI